MEPPVLPGFTPEGAPDPVTASRAAAAWLSGGLVGLPTETVYGLAADAQDPGAVARVYRAKGRPADHPVIVHVQGPEAISGWAAAEDPVARALAVRFWPGPLTLVVHRGARAADGITGGQETVALRCPGHPVALACIRQLARASGDPARGVAAPSANRFGRVSPTSAADVLAELGAHLDPGRDLIVEGGTARVGVESTIVDCTVTPPRVLRLGAIGQAEIDAALADAGLAGGARGPAGPVRAPGTLESHYAPAAGVRLVEEDEAVAVMQATAAPGGPTPGRMGLIAPAAVAAPEGWHRLASPADAASYAHELYRALRLADALGLDEVVAVLPRAGGDPLADAVRDRLARSAHPAHPAHPATHAPRT